ncbi:hypothetical protein [Sporosarcina sp. Marseille-Q4943]|uniref:hypothetical protein n=1 Tax=Sporosarcina sp. Marseille-Q4943 TaxID=2942204 RepID=UPI00208DBAE9|nr:hypothetical protein [Sporosarcina sp. Marseille-Q4943]
MNYPSIPRLSNQAISVPLQPLTLREGQMFHGQIKQLFPGQMAEVQIGEHKLMAKLEVPMKAGDAYYFQVKTVSPELQIKVVSGPLQTTDGQSKQISNLMESMQLPKSPEMQSVLSHFIKQRLPVSREILLNAAALLKTAQPSVHNEALNSIQRLVELKLPLTETNFNSILGVEAKEGLHDALNSLRDALIRDTGIHAKIKEAVLATLGDAGRMAASAAERALLSGAMLKLLDDNVPREERFQVLQLLRSSGIIPQNATLANLQTVLHSEMIDSTAGNVLQSGRLASHAMSSLTQMETPSSTLLELWKSVLIAEPSEASSGLDMRLEQLKDMIKNNAVLQQPFKLHLTGLLEELERTPTHEIKNSPVSEQVSKMIIRMIMEQNQSTPFRADVTTGFTKTLHPENVSIKLPELFRAMEQSSLPVTKELVQGAQTAVEQAIDGKVMKDAMQSLFKSLGFNYEAGLMQRNVDIGRTMDMLKPQLVALLHDSAVSPALRDAAEAIVTRMNGTLIQSGDAGLNQQIIMQLPLELLGKRIDATIQWNGRKKADGKIDADFARILFYLELDSIKKTVVDMQVQNRVVAVTIFNQENQLREIGNVLQGKLRNGLESVNYQLSGVTFKNFEEEGIKESKRRNGMMTDHVGVDFRI